ncbi:MAG: glutathione S-transferase family protein [Desulforhopalus sp.]
MKLLLFPHSHYCEKGRWALDYKELSYQAVPLLPGFHIRTVRKYAPGSSVPVLLTGEAVVQGSSEIIDFLDQRYQKKKLTPDSDEEQQLCREFETWGDATLGVPLRQILYHRLLAYPFFICRCFTYEMDWMRKLVFMLSYPMVRKRIHQVYVRSEEEVAEAHRIFAGGLQKLEEKLDDREFLVGEGFTRADLSIASMLSILVLPVEHPFPWGEIPDPEIRNFRKTHRNRQFFQWVERIYRDHR